jgi:hypothetical protein
MIRVKGNRVRDPAGSADCETGHVQPGGAGLFLPTGSFLFIEGWIDVDAAEGLLVVQVRGFRTLFCDLPSGPAFPASVAMS